MKSLLILFSFFTFSSYSQSSNTYILKTTRFLPVSNLEKALNLDEENKLRVIFEDLNLYSFELLNVNDNLTRFYESKFVEFIEKDEELVLRQIPNDEKFNQQYALKQIKADKAWDFTTGGVTFNGDTIVIAVLDGGCDIFHEDLFSNIWINKQEIPNDSIDNDENGYIDDYYGVNILHKNGNHRSKNHGTSVAGIVGAVGNNTIGISGINWNVKILPVTDILSKERIIEGYGYVYNLRKKYNESNGNEGAFVVCANFSGGTPTPQFPEDSEENMMWCEVYDKLGEVGVISVVSTDNHPRDIGIEGDMPSLCTSEYLVTVASTDENDKFYRNSAFSKIYVDIAAPGKNIYSLGINNDTIPIFTGNSAAAPMVAGAVGLLYTLPCEDFVREYLTNPSELALKVKSSILKYTDKHNDLKEKTVSGGRLNIVETYVGMLDEICSELDFREIKINKIYPNPAHEEIQISYSSNNYHNHKIIIYNNLGQTVYKEVFRPSPFKIKTKCIDVSRFTKGIYYFSLISNNNSIARQIVIY